MSTGLSQDISSARDVQELANSVRCQYPSRLYESCLMKQILHYM